MIDNFVSTLETSVGWRGIVDAVNSSSCPQSLSVTIPSALQELFVRHFGELLLGSSPSWKEGTHADLINAGKYLTPPTIDECRALRTELALYPLVSKFRLAVIWEANKLSKEASNSLLKLTEEPPNHGHILFISEEDKLIPTIKSRVRSIYIDLPDILVAPKRVPSTTEDFAEWVSKSKKTTSESLYLEIQSWVKYLTNEGDFTTAAELESMIRIMQEKRLSVTMVQDAIYGVLKEGIPSEQIFGSLWKA